VTVNGVSTKSSLVDARLRCVIRSDPIRPRKLFGLRSVGPYASWGAHNSDVETLARGILERVLLCQDTPGVWARPRQPHPQMFRYIMRDFRTQVVKRCPIVLPLSSDEFVNSYKGKQRSTYANALESFKNEPLTYKDAVIQVFVKAEKLPFHRKEDPAPRVIQPRTPRFHVRYGRFVKPMEKVIYGAIDRAFGEPTVMKGYNASQLGRIVAKKWGKYRKPVGVGSDASRFDQHVHQACMSWCGSLFVELVPKNRRAEFRSLFNYKRSTHGVGHANNGMCIYDVDYGLTSGDMDTALIGCLVMSGLLYTYIAFLKQIRPSFKCSVLDMGDDSYVIMEAEDLGLYTASFKGFFNALGFNIVVEDPVYTLEEVEFCQMHPVFDGSHYTMVRNFPNAWSKDVVSLLPLDNEKTFKRWCTAVGLAGLSWMGGIPVFDALYRSMILCDNPLVHPTLPRGLLMWGDGMDRRSSPINDATRVSFYFAFGVPPDEQISLERNMFVPTYSRPDPRWWTIGREFYHTH